MMKYSRSILLFFLSLAASTASAIIYDENIDGDIVHTTAPSIFTLDAGMNTFSGTTSIDNAQSLFDLDYIAFEIKDGLQVSSLTFDFIHFGEVVWTSWNFKTGALWGAPDIGTIILQDSATPTSPVSNGSTYVSSGSPYIFPLVDPLAAGQYLLGSQGFAGYGAGGLDYTISFNVTPVPEPSSIILLLLGLIAIGVFTKRTKTKRGRTPEH